MLAIRDRGADPSDPKALGRAGDAESNELLLRELAAARPDDAVLSEESADSPARLSADRVWIIDPLDGTREFGLPGRPDWAVHVALWQRDAEVTGSITAPRSRSPRWTSPTRRTRPRARATDRERPVFLVSDSRPPAWAAPVAADLNADLAPMGSAGAKAMAVLRGDADAYLHAGGQWEWDSAAPVGVVAAAGPARLAHRRHRVALQPRTPLSARPADLSAGAGRAVARRDRRPPLRREPLPIAIAARPSYDPKGTRDQGG